MLLCHAELRFFSRCDPSKSHPDTACDALKRELNVGPLSLLIDAFDDTVKILHRAVDDHNVITFPKCPGLTDYAAMLENPPGNLSIAAIKLTLPRAISQRPAHMMNSRELRQSLIIGIQKNIAREKRLLLAICHLTLPLHPDKGWDQCSKPRFLLNLTSDTPLSSGGALDAKTLTTSHIN